MSRTRNTILLFALALVFMHGHIPFCFQAYAGEGPVYSVREGGPICIGIGTLLSGIDSYLGGEVLAGARAFVTDHPTLLGHPLSLVPLDDGCDPMMTVEQAKAFCSMHPKPIAVIGYLCAPGCLQALEVHNQCNLPLLNVSSADSRLTNQGSPWFLRVWTSHDRQAVFVAQWIHKKRYRRVLLFHETDPESSAIAGAFEQALSKYASRCKAAILPLDESSQDAASLFEGTEAPQLVYYVGEERGAVDVLKSLPERALQVPWIVSCRQEAWPSDNVDFPLPKELYSIGLQLPTGDPQSPEYQYFRGRFGEPGVYTFAAYDALSILINALQKTANSDQEGTLWNMTDLMEAMRETDMPGLSGPIAFDENGNRTLVSGQIFKWHDGDWEVDWSGSIPKATSK
jgi:branched-chain amino acid transport system substrate-binding protein